VKSVSQVLVEYGPSFQTLHPSREHVLMGARISLLLRSDEHVRLCDEFTLDLHAQQDAAARIRAALGLEPVDEIKRLLGR
jgi:hypothetical protein